MLAADSKQVCNNGAMPAGKCRWRLAYGCGAHRLQCLALFICLYSAIQVCTTAIIPSHSGNLGSGAVGLKGSEYIQSLVRCFPINFDH